MYLIPVLRATHYIYPLKYYNLATNNYLKNHVYSVFEDEVLVTGKSLILANKIVTVW